MTDAEKVKKILADGSCGGKGCTGCPGYNTEGDNYCHGSDDQGPYGGHSLNPEARAWFRRWLAEHGEGETRRLIVGQRIQRAAGWRWGNQGAGSHGVVTRDRGPGDALRYEVDWDNGEWNSYDAASIEPETEVGKPVTRFEVGKWYHFDEDGRRGIGQVVGRTRNDSRWSLRIYLLDDGTDPTKAGHHDGSGTYPDSKGFWNVSECNLREVPAPSEDMMQGLAHHLGESYEVKSIDREHGTITIASSPAYPNTAFDESVAARIFG